jgi:hypothetical protein
MAHWVYDMAHWNFEEGAMGPFSKNLSISLMGELNFTTNSRQEFVVCTLVCGEIYWFKILLDYFQHWRSTLLSKLEK